MDFADLKAAVAGYMHRTDLTSEIPDFIELARQRLDRDLRVREMIVQLGIVPTTNPFPVPDDFEESRDLYHTVNSGGQRISLRFVGRGQLARFTNPNAGTSTPRFYSIDGLLIETRPGGIDVEFTLVYYAKVPELVNDTDENEILDNYFALWLNGSLIEGFSFTQNAEQRDIAIATYSSELGNANSQSAYAESGAGLTVQPSSCFI